MKLLKRIEICAILTARRFCMLSVRGYYENGVCVPTETLNLEDRQQVIHKGNGFSAIGDCGTKSL